ncbi:MAG: ribonuclease J [Clostridia bacterium]|jgi:ribonuclease J|nr:ribonuclease J [Clostridia bacterium]
MFKKPVNKTSGSSSVRIVPLGGLDEIGKNITAIEYNNEIVVIDCGIAFPDDSMLGVDVVIPDFTYLKKNKNKIKGVVITHGHEDHIGGLPYLLKEINVPIYGSKLAIGLVENKLREHKIINTVKRNSVKPGSIIKLGGMKVEFIRTTHSIADAFAIAIHTPEGVVLHSGDFKVDYTPIHGDMIDLHRFAELGKKGVLAFLCESTNVERAGYTKSESTIGPTFEDIFIKSRDSRIMIATFASNIDRVQQVITQAHKNNRKVAVVGRSMVNVVKIASELGYLNVPKGIMVEISEVQKMKPEEVVVIMTGSQGEPMAALSRMANGSHRQLEVIPGDTIVLSSTPIPGNESSVNTVINELIRRGADVVLEDTHVSGHACREEIKLLHSLVKPKYFVPVHGEFRHLKAHAELAQELGMNRKNIFVSTIGDVIEVSKDKARKAKSVEAGRVLVDGLGVGDVGNVVLRDRKHLSEDGLIVAVVTVDSKNNKIVGKPELVSRGFVYVKESEELLREAKDVVNKAIEGLDKNRIKEWSYVKNEVKDKLSDYLWRKTKRSPMILPIIVEV